MRRAFARRPLAAVATLAMATTIGVTAISMSAAQAATGGVTGYATQNGGTTGGAGGTTVTASTGTAIHTALCNRASTSTPITIQVSGTITVGNTAKVSGTGCSTADGVIELKNISNVTIVGVGGGATFDQIGIHIRDSKNIIIQNVTVKNVKKSGSPTSNGGDAIGMESTVRNVWVDHVTLEASGGESEGYDGLFDLKNDVQYVTLSYSILRNSGRGGLIGSSEDDRGNGFITFHHNSYSNLDSRTPLLRGGIAHIYNNSYTNLDESGINSRAGAKAKVENNYFKNSKDVLGTFYTSEAGTWQVAGNIFDNVTWSAKGSDNNPAGPNVVSTTSVSIPYSYTPGRRGLRARHRRQTAGANTGLKVSDGSCTPTTPTATPTSTPTSTPTTTPTPTPTPTPTSTTPSGTNLSLARGRGRVEQGQRDQLRQRQGRLHEHVLVAERLHRQHLGQVGIGEHGRRTSTSEASGAAGRIGAWGCSTATRARCSRPAAVRAHQLHRDVAEEGHPRHHQRVRDPAGRRDRDVRQLT